MLSFIFGSTMVVVMAGALAMMFAVRRHKKFRKFTKWVTFLFGLMAGSAAALCFVGQWAGALLTGAFALVGIPAAFIGVAALFYLIGAIGDLLDGVPDGFALSAALVLPTLAAVSGGALGLYGDQATGMVSQAGAVLLNNLIGLGA
ncbi:hypothetical protein ACIRPH_31720 [Nocardiopsis sp. NPDC101807]|uniref:hypothetical protein n=1 Tax=Nocardiopsis sp. NPDC101807 TaxID=3364339 RepID=UPI00380325EC